MPISTVWLNQPVFVSSTFIDMNFERDYLHQFIFPEIQERLLSYNYHLEVLDFRWGIDTLTLPDPESKERTVLKVCLAEINRCRPFLFVLLGDRYGWIPEKKRILAAADEVQLPIGSEPYSVTRLEIEYGLLNLSNHAIRPFFYFRNRLPYDTMKSELIDNYTDEKCNPEAFRLLKDLKQKISERFPQNVRDYIVNWDAETNKVIGLQDFGEKVKEDIWAALQEELQLKEEKKPGWLEQEQQLLESFVEGHCRNFTGRKEVLENIISRCSQTSLPTENPVILLIGESGAGKSAIFSMLYRKLQDKNSGLVLAHSAGFTPSSVQVNSMLRRWCGQLANFLDVTDDSDQLSDSEQLSQYFRSLLNKAAEKTFVLLLVDALEQFETTTTASYVTWLPRLNDWPKNLLMFGTATPESTQEGVLSTYGTLRLAVPEFSVEDAGLLAEKICGHYHKQLSAGLRQLLLAKQTMSGTRASGMPFWITLTVNELMVLDADDFAKTAQFEGTAEERLAKLLLYTVDTIPGELKEAINYLFNRLEHIYGQNLVKFILVNLSLSREGIREKDLEKFYKASRQTNWDPTLFAVIRRSIKTFIRQQGITGKWTLTHRLLFEVARERYYPINGQEVDYHNQLGIYLNDQKEDELRSEAFYHLLQAGNSVLAYANLNSTNIDLLPGFHFKTMATLLRDSEDANAALDLLSSLLNAPFKDEKNKNINETSVFFYITGERLMQFMEVMREDVGVEKGMHLASRMEKPIEENAQKDPSNGMYGEMLFKLLQIKAQQLNALGREDESLQTSIKAGEINEKHIEGWKRKLEASKDEGNDRKMFQIYYHQSKHSLMLNHINISDHYEKKNDTGSAIAWMKKALEISGWFMDIYPQSPLANLDMANNHIKLVNLYLSQRDVDNAAPHCTESLRLTEWLVSKAPTEIRYAILRADSYRQMAMLLSINLKFTEAEEYFVKSYDLYKQLAEQNPGDRDLQWRYLNVMDELANFYAMLHDLDSSGTYYAYSVQRCGLMKNIFGENTRVTRHFSYCCSQAAMLRELVGDVDGAMRSQSIALNLEKELQEEKNEV